MPPDDLQSVLSQGRLFLEAAHIENARLDARLLLQHAAGLSHEALIADPKLVLSEDAVAVYRAALRRRATHEPVSRILGEREFYGRSFRITPTVLDPRPDTETLIEAVLSFLPANEPRRILDLGTGSGAIIVTLLAERPAATGTATDISPAALVVAQANALRHGVDARLALAQANWFEGILGSFDVIVSNPPYIRSSEFSALPPEVGHFDPAAALDGGPDGLDAYRRMASDAPARIKPGGRVFVEIGERQAIDVTAVFADQGLAPAGRWRDLAGRVRCVAFAIA